MQSSHEKNLQERSSSALAGGAYVPCSFKMSCAGRGGIYAAARKLFGFPRISRREAAVCKGYVRAIELPTGPRQNERVKLRDELRVQQLPFPLNKIYGPTYITRLYLYQGFNLRARNKGTSTHQSADPFVVVHNGEGPGHNFNQRDMAKQREVNPAFFQVFELETVLPQNHRLEIQVWDKDRLTLDDLIGTCEIDLEERLLQGAAMNSAKGQAVMFTYQSQNRENLPLMNPGSAVPQGVVTFMLDILPEEMARKHKVEELHAPKSGEYELRMVIWNTKEIKFPEDMNRGHHDVDQQIAVTTNFEGMPGQDHITWTDVAWYSAGGSAEWNYRMLFPVTLPCKVPRLKLTMWDAKVLKSNQALAEIMYNLQPFFDRCLREKKPICHQPQRWFTFTRAGEPLGKIIIELWLYTLTEAQKRPAGVAQEQPNVDPYLPPPLRNPPPWAIGTRGMAWFARRRLILMIIVSIVILIPLSIVFFPSLTSLVSGG